MIGRSREARLERLALAQCVKLALGVGPRSVAEVLLGQGLKFYAAYIEFICRKSLIGVKQHS